MKKYIFTFFLLLTGLCVSAQSSYEKNINEKAKKISSAKTATDYDKLFSEFSALTRSKDPYRYKAYYFAGLAMYKKAEMNLAKNPAADERRSNGTAEKFISGALAEKQDDKESRELLDLISAQKKKIQMNAATN